MKYADLHLHTHFSDSTFSPQDLLREVEKAKLSCISIVDHDTVDGIEPVVTLAKDIEVEVLSGIELTAEYEGSEIHILGYLIDYKNKYLKEKLDFLKNYRIERVYKIVDKLKSLGINLNPQAVLELGKFGTVGRLHIARAMFKEGLTGSIFEAFQKYIGDNGPAYVSGFRHSPQEAIKLVKSSGGIPVLAHPYSLKNDELLMKIIADGIMGLEVYYHEHSQAMVNFYLGLAKNYNLLATGGSDCHGTAKPEARVGSTRIPYSLVEELKKAKDRL